MSKKKKETIVGEKIKWCRSPLQLVNPCDIGWATATANSVESCRDGGNCTNLVQEGVNYEYCSKCKQLVILKNKGV